MRVLHLRPVIEYVNLNLRRRIFSRGHADVLPLSRQHRAHVIKLVPVKHRRLHFLRRTPIHASQIHQHPDRIPRPRQHACRHLIRRRRLPARGRHPLHRIHFLSALVQMHLVLQTRQVRNLAVRIEFVVQLKHHPVRILRMRKRLQVPGILARNISSLAYLHPQIRHYAVQFRNICREVQRLTGPRLKSHRRATRPFRRNRRGGLRSAARCSANRFRLARSNDRRSLPRKQRLRLRRFISPERPHPGRGQSRHNQQPHPQSLAHSVCALLLIFSVSVCRSHRTIR